jgi:hypothetical protein
LVSAKLEIGSEDKIRGIACVVSILFPIESWGMFPDTHSGISHPSNRVDIDKLSRGEIEVISQFLPLVEHQILRKLIPYSDGSSFSDIVVLMNASPTSSTAITIKVTRIL